MIISSITRTTRVKASQASFNGCTRALKNTCDAVEIYAANKVKQVLAGSELRAFLKHAKKVYKEEILKKFNIKSPPRLSFNNSKSHAGKQHHLLNMISISKRILTDPDYCKLVGIIDGKEVELTYPKLPFLKAIRHEFDTGEIAYFKRSYGCEVKKVPLTIQERKEHFLKIIMHETAHSYQDEVLERGGFSTPRNPLKWFTRAANTLAPGSKEERLAERFLKGKNSYPTRMVPASIAMSSDFYMRNPLEMHAYRAQTNYKPSF